MAVAYPKLNVKIVGFMPGLSSPGGPSHQAIDDVALMRALPNMTVVEPADALEVAQAVNLIADHLGLSICASSAVKRRLSLRPTTASILPEHRSCGGTETAMR